MEAEAEVVPNTEREARRDPGFSHSSIPDRRFPILYRKSFLPLLKMKRTFSGGTLLAYWNIAKKMLRILGYGYYILSFRVHYLGAARANLILPPTMGV